MGSTNKKFDKGLSEEDKKDLNRLRKEGQFKILRAKKDSSFNIHKIRLKKEQESKKNRIKKVKKIRNKIRTIIVFSYKEFLVVVIVAISFRRFFSNLEKFEQKLNDQLENTPKPWFKMGVNVNLKSKEEEPKPKIVSHVYPPAYSLPGLPIIYEEEKEPLKVFRPDEPVDVEEVIGPLQAIKRIRKSISTSLDKRKDSEKEKVLPKPKSLRERFLGRPKKDQKTESASESWVKKLNIRNYNTLWTD